MRDAYVDHKNRFILFWSPKCACTSLGEWFAFGIAGYDRGEERSTAPYVLKARQEHGVAFQTALPFIQEGYASAAFTRNPFDRAVSAYVSKFVLNYGQLVQSFDQLEIFAKSLYLDITGQTEDQANENYRGITFLDYLVSVEQSIRLKSTREPQLDQHWNTQTPFLFAEEDIRPTEIYDIADLQKAIDNISGRYGYSTVSNWANRTARESSSRAEFLGDVSSLELARSGTVPTPEQLLSRRTAKLVTEAYSIDYQYLGYDLPTTGGDHE